MLFFLRLIDSEKISDTSDISFKEIREFTFRKLSIFTIIFVIKVSKYVIMERIRDTVTKVGVVGALGFPHRVWKKSTNARQCFMSQTFLSIFSKTISAWRKIVEVVLLNSVD